MEIHFKKSLWYLNQDPPPPKKKSQIMEEVAQGDTKKKIK